MTTPLCRMTRLPKRQRSRTETLACRTQLSPTDTSAPRKTPGNSTQPRPTVTPGDTYTNGKTVTSAPREAVESTLASGLMPGWYEGAGYKRDRTRAKARYASATCKKPLPRGGGSTAVFSAMMIPLAWQALRCALYRGLARKVMSPGPASSIEAAFDISAFPSPITLPPTSSASCASVLGTVVTFLW